LGENKWSIGQKSAKKDHKGRQKEEKTQKEADRWLNRLTESVKTVQIGGKERGYDAGKCIKAGPPARFI
jgi:hypothetical protein